MQNFIPFPFLFENIRIRFDEFLNDQFLVLQNVKKTTSFSLFWKAELSQSEYTENNTDISKIISVEPTKNERRYGICLHPIPMHKDPKYLKDKRSWILFQQK